MRIRLEKINEFIFLLLPFSIISGPFLADLSVVIINILHEDQVNSILSRYNKMDIKYVKGDHTREVILEKANVKNASSAIVLTDDSKGEDQKTILCTLTIKNMNPDLRVIAQVSNRENITHLRRANVDEIIINDKFETFMTASHILDPGVPQAIYQLIDSQSMSSTDFFSALSLISVSRSSFVNGFFFSGTTSSSAVGKLSSQILFDESISSSSC